MTETSKIKYLYDFITENKDIDSDYWYFNGNDVLNIFKNFNSSDITELEKQVLKWDSEQIQILVECFKYGFIDEITYNKQSYFLTFLLANLNDESEEKLDILENASDIILKGEPKPIELLNLIINWIEQNNYNQSEYYRLHASCIYEAQKRTIKFNKIKEKINFLKVEISSLSTKYYQAFYEMDNLRLNAYEILKSFNNDDLEQLKLDIISWKNDELEILSKVFSQGRYRW